MSWILSWILSILHSVPVNTTGMRQNARHTARLECDRHTERRGLPKDKNAKIITSWRQMKNKKGQSHLTRAATLCTFPDAKLRRETGGQEGAAQFVRSSRLEWRFSDGAPYMVSPILDDASFCDGGKTADASKR